MQASENLSASDGDEFGLIDLLIPIVDNIKLLIFLPALAAICAWAYTMNQPLVYESTSWLRLQAKSSIITPQEVSAQQIALYESALLELTNSDVLAVLLESPEVTTLTKSKGLEGEAAYNQLRQQVTPVFDKKAMLLKLTTRADQAYSAQILNQKLVEAFVKLSLPKGNYLESLSAQILQTQESIKLLQAELTKNQSSKADARATSELLIQLLTRSDRLLELQNQTKLVGSEIFVQQPHLPVSAKRPKQVVTVVSIFFITLFFVLLFIFIRLAWTNFSQDPKNAEKVNHIRHRLGWAK